MLVPTPGVTADLPQGGDGGLVPLQVMPDPQSDRHALEQGKQIIAVYSQLRLSPLDPVSFF